MEKEEYQHEYWDNVHHFIFLLVQGNTAVIVCGSRAHLQDEAVAQVRET